MIASMKQFIMILALALSAMSLTEGFVPNSQVSLGKLNAAHAGRVAGMKEPSTTQLMARNPYNYNEGQSPWGLKKNGEIWNGRVAMVRVCFCRKQVTDIRISVVCCNYIVRRPGIGTWLSRSSRSQLPFLLFT